MVTTVAAPVTPPASDPRAQREVPRGKKRANGDKTCPADDAAATKAAAEQEASPPGDALDTVQQGEPGAATPLQSDSADRKRMDSTQLSSETAATSNSKRNKTAHIKGTSHNTSPSQVMHQNMLSTTGASVDVTMDEMENDLTRDDAESTPPKKRTPTSGRRSSGGSGSAVQVTF